MYYKISIKLQIVSNHIFNMRRNMQINKLLFKKCIKKNYLQTIRVENSLTTV